MARLSGQGVGSPSGVQISVGWQSIRSADLSR